MDNTSNIPLPLFPILFITFPSFFKKSLFSLQFILFQLVLHLSFLKTFPKVFFLAMYLFLAVLGVPCCVDFSLVVASGGYSLVVVCGLLLWQLLLWSMGSRTPGLYSTGSTAVVNQLSCSAACGIFPDRGSNPCLLHWQGDSLPLSHQGSPSQRFYHLFKPTLLISFPSSLHFHVDYLL